MSQNHGITAKPENLKVNLTLPSGLSPTNTIKINLNGQILEFRSNDKQNIENELSSVLDHTQKIKYSVDIYGQNISFMAENGQDISLIHTGGTSASGIIEDITLQVFDRLNEPKVPIKLSPYEVASFVAPISYALDADVNTFSFVRDYNWHLLDQPQIGLSHPIKEQILGISIDGRPHLIKVEDGDGSTTLADKLSKLNGIKASKNLLTTKLTLPSNLSNLSEVTFSVNGLPDIICNSNNPINIQQNLNSIFSNTLINAYVDRTGTQITFETTDPNDLQITHEGFTGINKTLAVQVIDTKGNSLSPVTLSANETAFSVAEVAIKIDDKVY